MKTKILNYNIFNKSMLALLEYIDKSDKINIISGNPEVLYTGLNNPELFKSFSNRQSIIIPDGIGVVLASKIVGQKVEQKIAGIEVMNELLKKCETENKPVYLLGAKIDVLEGCKKNIQSTYPSINIIGKHDGYFDLENCPELIQDIVSKKPYVLFVAMGCPRQEKFIAKYMDILPCNIFMGVGGSFDVFAGFVNRAPEWMIKSGLEWLYRVSKEPKRVMRLTSIPKFLFKVVISNKK